MELAAKNGIIIILMGRGGRDQALRVKSLPRLLSRPDKIGQKRYSVVRHDTRSGKESREPGHLRSTHEWARGNKYQDLYIAEEIAVPDSKGRLRWIDNQRMAVRTYYGYGDLNYLRRRCDKLNDNNMGFSVHKTVDADGLLEIGLSETVEGPDGNPQDKASDTKKFDVVDPAQAEAAQQYYQQMSQRVAEIDQENAELAINRLRLHDPEAAKQFFADQDAARKADKAEKFAEALDSGKADQLIETVESESQAEQARQAQLSESEQADKARRAQETLRSLSKT